MKKKMSGKLFLELLESRRLLSATIEGVEVDGDLYEIRLTGPGKIDVGDLDGVELRNTTSKSHVTIQVIEIHGDGLVAVRHLDTAGDKLGNLTVMGDLGGLNVGKLNRLEANTLGLTAGSNGEFDINGSVDQIKVDMGIFDVDFEIADDVQLIQVGLKTDESSDVRNSRFDIDGDLKRLLLRQSLTANSEIDVDGDIGLVDIDRYLVSSSIHADGHVARMTIDGGISLNSTIDIDGDLNFLKVKKSVSDTTFDIGGALPTATFNDDVVDSLLTANSIGSLSVKDDFNDSQVGVTANITMTRMGDSRGLTLQVGGSSGPIKVARSLDNAIISVLKDIGMIKIGGDLNRSLIMGGYNIGNDFALATADDTEWGHLDLQGVIVKGDMIDSSISAGIRPNGLFFGDGDDTATVNHVGSARILKVNVRGQIGSTSIPGEMYAISADDGIERILSHGKEFTGNDGVIVQEF